MAKKTAANETPEQIFIRLANARVNKAITSIRAVGKLAKRNTNSEYATKIVAALVAGVDLVETQFQPKPKEEEKPGFTL